MRLLFLLLLAAFPLLAGAHGADHLAPRYGSGKHAGPHATGLIRAVVAAPSRCPGGEHENCCCHDAACTPSFHPVAMDARSAERSTPPVCEEQVSQAAVDAPRTVAPARHSPRGPPTRS